MCGAYFLQQSASLREHFGIVSQDDIGDFMLDGGPAPFSLFDAPDQEMLAVFRPTDKVPFLALGRNGQWVGRSATWWLAMDRKGDHWEPNQKLASFNSRIDKVTGTGRSIHTMPPRSFRVVVPATGFVEWHDRRPHLFVRSDGRAIRLGGMAKAYEIDDGYQYAVSIVTLPGHEKTRHIHQKSVPLMLSEDLMPAWLDRSLPHSDFRHLQNPLIPHDLQIQPVADLKTMYPAGETEAVASDL